MARLTAQEAADKWARNLSGSTEDIRKGIERVDVAPGQKAAASADVMLARLTESVRNGTWARKVAGVPLDEWKRKTLEKGLGRIAAGVESAREKQAVMYEQLLRNVDAATAKVHAMPNITLEDRINRMVTYTREMAGKKLR